MNIEEGQGNPIDNPVPTSTFSDDEISSLVNMLNSMHKCVQAEGILEISRILFGSDSPVVPKLVDAGLVPKILEFIVQENNNDLLIESLSCIGKICSEGSPFVEHVIELGGIDILLNYLDSSYRDIVEEVLWAFRNITFSGINARDLCLKKGIVNKLIEILERFPNKFFLIQSVFWIIQNLTRGEPFPDWEKISPLLPILHKYISEASSEEILDRALWSLRQISYEKIQEVIDQGCVPLLMKHLFGTERIALGALKTLGNLLLGHNDQTIVIFLIKKFLCKQPKEILMFDEFLPKLFEFTQSSNPEFQKEAFWIISNLTAIEIDLILKNDDYMAKIKNGVVTASPEAAEEAGWAICNIFLRGNPNQIAWAIKNQKIMKSFPAILILEKEPKLKHEVLGIIFNVLMIAGINWEGISIKDVEEANLIETLKELAEEEEFSAIAKFILRLFPNNQIEEAQK